MAGHKAKGRRAWRVAVSGLAVAVLAVVLLAAAAGFFDRRPDRWFGRGGSHPDVVAVLFSGDMGLRFGMGPYVARALADQGLPVMGVSSSTLFATHKTRAQVDALVATAIDEARARTGARRVVVVGQSFGSDMLRVALSDMTPARRRSIVQAVLVVPGRDAYFRADPTGFAYRGPPEADASDVARLNWLPLACIRGAEETDSLCPAFRTANVRTVTLPGGHFLDNDHALLARTVVRLVAPAIARAEGSGQ